MEDDRHLLQIWKLRHNRMRPRRLTTLDFSKLSFDPQLTTSKQHRHRRQDRSPRLLWLLFVLGADGRVAACHLRRDALCARVLLIYLLGSDNHCKVLFNSTSTSLGSNTIRPKILSGPLLTSLPFRQRLVFVRIQRYRSCMSAVPISKA